MIHLHRLILALCLAFALASAALAGPWPRDAGTGFAALSVERARLPLAGRGPMELYAEWGLPGRRVLALALAEGPGLRRADLLLRWHPPDPAPGLALGLTGGLRATPRDALRWRLIAGADLGRGWDTGAGNLWLRAGARLLPGRDAAGWDLDLDLSAQLGLRRGDWMGLVGLTHYRSRTDRRTRLRPALGYAVSPRLTLVGEAALAPGAAVESLRLSVWSRF
jgi:hypothetical protein